jgi:hypothetical protein
MSEYSININSICGKNIVTRDDGKKVYDLIIRHWNESTRIKIDFGNVLIASVSFMDEIFGKLALNMTDRKLCQNSKLRTFKILIVHYLTIYLSLVISKRS